MDSLKFAGFIMTYERPSILEGTLDKIFSQTVSPEKILIVDNSTSTGTKELIEKLNNPKVIYHKVGYNSGPAGAAAIGLQLLATEGYEWIYWGDDDDPPVFENTFEILLRTAISTPMCGSVGVVGQYFNAKTGFIQRVADAELQTEGILRIDTIAGGMSKIVNGKMVLQHAIFPEEKLFYGAEELDFDLKIKKAGYQLLVDRAFYLKHRQYYNRINLATQSFNKKSETGLMREYYSIRNMFWIFYKNRLFTAFVVTFWYYLLKQFLRFKFGVKSGFVGLKVFFLALFHCVFGKMGFQKINI